MALMARGAQARRLVANQSARSTTQVSCSGRPADPKCRRCVDIDTFDYGSQESIACALESDTISPKVHVSYRDYNDRILFTNSHQEEQNFMCKSLKGLVQEITWLQQLSHKKMEELQALVEARR